MAVNNGVHHIKVAILGLNPVSQSLIPLFQLSGFKVTCIWDSDVEKAKDQCLKNGLHLEDYWEQYPVKWEDVLVSPNVDLVYIANSPSLHAEITVKALAVGRHVVCQNPPAASVDGAKRMLSMVEYYPKLFGGLSSHFRFLPAVRKMKELIVENNYCGKMLMVEARIDAESIVQGSIYDWKCDSSVGGGTLNILGSHLVDLMVYLTHSRVTEVSGFLNTFHAQTSLISGFRKITSDDHCSVQMCCSNGMRASFTINCAFSKGFHLTLTVNGENGYLRLKDFDLYGCRSDQLEEVLLHKESQLSRANQTVVGDSDLSGYIQFVNLGCHGMLSWLHREISCSCSDSETSLKEAIVFDPLDMPFASMATFEDGLNIQRILSAAFQSSCSRKWCVVSSDKEEITQVHEGPFWQSRYNGSLLSLESQNLLKPPHHHVKKKKEARKMHSHS